MGDVRTIEKIALSLALSLGVASCSNEETGSGDTESDSGEETSDVPEGHARVVHSFGVYELGPNEEITPCIQWTVNNDKPIYVTNATLTNNGGYHHSNWFIVPESFAPADDGFFDCKEKGFDELLAAVSGSVLFAQSTQSRLDGIELPEGVVVKIPPRHKIVAGGHLLNLSNDSYPTELRMSLEIVHPSEVDVVVAPFRLTYYDLHMPPQRESRFTASCDFKTTYEAAAEVPFDMKLYYVMPHYHYLGNFFDLSFFGGPRDGESIFQLEGFNAENNGQSYTQPIDMTGSTGFTFTCGFNNWRDVEIGWGIGDQEMCVMLGLADSRVLIDASAGNNEIVGDQDGVLMNNSECNILGLPKNEAQTLPTAEEIAAELYVPPSDPNDQDLPHIPECADVSAEISRQGEATLSSIRDTLFVSSCAFSSCHQGEQSALGLDLTAEDLHGELLGHDVSARSDLPLIAPGDPEGSWLYQRLAKCEPTGRGDEPVSHMPLNAPFLADPRLVAKVRDWIAAGAPND